MELVERKHAPRAQSTAEQHLINEELRTPRDKSTIPHAHQPTKAASAEKRPCKAKQQQWQHEDKKNTRARECSSRHEDLTKHNVLAGGHHVNAQTGNRQWENDKISSSARRLTACTCALTPDTWHRGVSVVAARRVITPRRRNSRQQPLSCARHNRRKRWRLPPPRAARGGRRRRRRQ